MNATKLADLPVQAATKYQLAIKGESALRLAISLSLTEPAGLKLSEGRISDGLGKLIAIEAEYEEANGR